MIIFTKGTKSYEVFHSVDKFFAGVFGMRFGDQYTISAQCYRSECILCEWLGSILNLIQPDHFKISAELEGLDK